MATRAKTAAEYAGLVDQAIGELQDIIEAASFDYDEVDTNLGYVNALLREMRALRSSMADGSYQFGRNDLPWMRIVKQHSEQGLPCIRLFYLINQTHREGLDIDSA
ncbi:MAG TPA: hypothetical protein VET88_08810 [Gammaproteobacteria bacterium]|nr:hypothetical protein [Gammaproteobacteria bacterium]